MPRHAAIRDIFGRFMTAITAPRRKHDFVCGDCERWQRCGLPPSDDCIIKAAQMARDADRPRKRFSLPVC
jgi:hypothetical protein